MIVTVITIMTVVATVVLVMMVITIVVLVFVLEEPISCSTVECSTEYLIVRFSSLDNWLIRVSSSSTSVLFMSLVKK